MKNHLPTQPYVLRQIPKVDQLRALFDPASRPVISRQYELTQVNFENPVNYSIGVQDIIPHLRKNPDLIAGFLSNSGDIARSHDRPSIEKRADGFHVSWIERGRPVRTKVSQDVFDAMSKYLRLLGFHDETQSRAESQQARTEHMRASTIDELMNPRH